MMPLAVPTFGAPAGATARYFSSRAMASGTCPRPSATVPRWNWISGLAGIERFRLEQGLLGLGAAPAVLEQDAEVVGVLRVRGRILGRRLRLGNRLVELAGRAEHHAQGSVRGSEVGLQLDGPAKLALGPGQVALALVGERQVVVAWRAARGACEDHLVLGDRLVEPGPRRARRPLSAARPRARPRPLEAVRAEDPGVRAERPRAGRRRRRQQTPQGAAPPARGRASAWSRPGGRPGPSRARGSRESGSPSPSPRRRPPARRSGRRHPRTRSRGRTCPCGRSWCGTSAGCVPCTAAAPARRVRDCPRRPGRSPRRCRWPAPQPGSAAAGRRAPSRAEARSAFS